MIITMAISSCIDSTAATSECLTMHGYASAMAVDLNIAHALCPHYTTHGRSTTYTYYVVRIYVCETKI